MGGTGATAFWACQDALRANRRMDAQLEANRTLRRAMRGLRSLEHAPSRHPFACGHLCVACGWLEPPTDAGDPMRSEPSRGPRRGCPRCGAHGWADLRTLETAEALAAAEQRELDLRAGLRIAPWLALVAPALFGAALAGIWHHVPAVFWLTTFGTATIFTAHYGRVLLHALQTPRRTAWRWHAPSRCVRPGRVTARGTVDADRTLRSPLGDRPCIAWRVEVRYRRDRGDAFALVEQAAATLALDGTVMTREPSLALPGAEIDVALPHVVRWLQTRGVDPNDVAALTEAVLDAGSPVVLRRDRSGPAPVLGLASAPVSARRQK